MSQVTTATPQASPPKGWQQRLRESRLGTVLVLAVTAALVTGGAYLVQRPTASSSSTASGGAAGGTTATNVVAGDGPAPKIGAPAQGFSGTTIEGQQVSLSSYKGQSVWLTFGASWCAACVAEAPDIQAAYEKFKAKGVVVLAISISEDSATVKDYADRVGLTYPMIADPQTTIASLYRVYGIPAHFFIDKAGVLHATKTGGLSTGQMDAALTELSK
jgi:cytochrome c biogenesis protein CcmG, thiol:disulfide interchange protein DsbE